MCGGGLLLCGLSGATMEVFGRTHLVTMAACVEGVPLCHGMTLRGHHVGPVSHLVGAWHRGSGQAVRDVRQEWQSGGLCVLNTLTD